MINLHEGAKLTRLNLATEAGVAKDMPFSRYRRGNAKAGEYRYPEVVGRSIRLRKKKSERIEDPREKKIDELKERVATLEELLAVSRGVANALDADNDKLRRCSELQEGNANLKSENAELEEKLAEAKRRSITMLTPKKKWRNI